MTDIEKAIKSCENKIKMYENRFGGIDFNRGSTLNSIALEKVKIQALREKAERDKQADLEVANTNKYDKAIKTINNLSNNIRQFKGISYGIDMSLEIRSSLDIAVETLRQVRDSENVQCENCQHYYKQCCVFDGLCERRKTTDFCSFFEPK